MRPIDADELLEHKFKSASERMDLSVAYMSGWNDAIDSINENAPTIEAEPVVKCKDCRYAHMTYGGECKYCDAWEEVGEVYLDGDFYCAFGEKKTDEVNDETKTD